MRIRPFLCPSSAEGPARRQNPSPVWRRTWRHQVSSSLVYSRLWIRIFFRHCVELTKVATEPKLPSLFFAMTTQQAQGNFEGSIMSYSSNISISARHASDLCGVIRLAPSLWGTAPSSSSILCSTKLQQPISAFRFKTAARIQNLHRLFSFLRVLFLAKPVCQILVHMTRGVPENSSSSTSRRPFRILLKTVYE